MLASGLKDVRWDESPKGLIAMVKKGNREEPAGWCAQPGSQMVFMACPTDEVLYEGNRGPGKTDALVNVYGRHVGKGWGAEWKGIIFRRTYPELEDVIQKSCKWFARMFPGSRYNGSAHTYHFRAGETLKFRHFERPSDYDSYHGHSFTFIGWEELTNWSSDECYKSMFSCSRSSVPGIPIIVRSTANPYGVGHNWVKARWKLPIGGGQTMGPIIVGAVNPDGSKQPDRVAVHGRLAENRILLHADPNYIARIREAARNPAELKAWLDGDWNIVAGGMFDDVYDAGVHVVPSIPLELLPLGWYIDRSYDHGQSAPFSVGWWVESNGEPFEYKGVTYGARRGDLYRIGEWYGARRGMINKGVDMLATDIADGIVEREKRWGLGNRVHPGPADTQIYNTDASGGKSVADDMQRRGVRWTRADKGPGSRVQGWQQIRAYLKHALNPMREAPGLFVFDSCDQFQQLLPVLPRDDRNLDDVDTESEDHIGDEVRYRVRHKRRKMQIAGPRVVQLSA